MTQTLIGTWNMELDRGPDWLFVRLLPPDSAPKSNHEIAAAVWNVMENAFIYRIVLELDALQVLHSQLLGELIRLARRVESEDGLLRICGLSEQNREVLRWSQLETRFAIYEDRADAVMGRRPSQPR